MHIYVGGRVMNICALSFNQPNVNHFTKILFTMKNFINYNNFVIEIIILFILTRNVLIIPFLDIYMVKYCDHNTYLHFLFFRLI